MNEDSKAVLRILFDVHASYASYRLKVVLLHLWRVNYPSDSRIYLPRLGGFCTQFNSLHNTITNSEKINIGRNNGIKTSIQYNSSKFVK